MEMYLGLLFFFPNEYFQGLEFLDWFVVCSQAMYYT